jgi:hypothetical protein
MATHCDKYPPVRLEDRFGDSAASETATIRRSLRRLGISQEESAIDLDRS